MREAHQKERVPRRQASPLGLTGGARSFAIRPLFGRRLRGKVKIALALTAAVLLNLPLLAYAQGPAGPYPGQPPGPGYPSPGNPASPGFPQAQWAQFQEL